MNAFKTTPHDDATKNLVHRMLAFIGQAHDAREKGLAELLGVSQPTVSRWISGELIPDAAHFAKIVATFHEACARVRALFPVPANLHYVCSFAPKYGEDRAEEAKQALKESVESVISTTGHLRQKHGGIHIDLHIRAASLQKGARAHCFADDRNHPSLFVILVSDALTFREQHLVAFDEAYAHVMNKLIDNSGEVRHPSPFI